MENLNYKPSLYIHVGQATHFLRWEIDEFSKFFHLVKVPSQDTPLLAFGPDVLNEASILPASARFAILFPGFSHNPVYNQKVKEEHIYLIKNFYTKVFINPGPLEIAYKELDNIEFYPFSVDTSLVKLKKYRKRINSLVHVSSDAPQKDWARSEEVMKNTGLKYEIYPPRNNEFHQRRNAINVKKNKLRTNLGMAPKKYLPYGYVDHAEIVKKYQQYDGFVHIARDIKDQIYIDGKYTASLIEAGITGSILFWHDTFGLSNHLETVFSLPLDANKASQEILDIRASIDIYKHSRLTHEEMMDTFNPYNSVAIRAQKILESI